MSEQTNQNKAADGQSSLTDGLDAMHNPLRKDAERYKWLRDNKHLDAWWSVQGPKGRLDNIDADIDAAMLEATNS